MIRRTALALALSFVVILSVGCEAAVSDSALPGVPDRGDPAGDLRADRLDDPAARHPGPFQGDDLVPIAAGDQVVAPPDQPRDGSAGFPTDPTAGDKPPRAEDPVKGPVDPTVLPPGLDAPTVAPEPTEPEPTEPEPTEPEPTEPEPTEPQVWTCPGDDGWEPNDSRDAAPLVANGVGVDLGAAACAGNADWYAIEVRARCALDVTVLFSHAEGDLHAQIHGPSGQLAGAYSSTDNEVLSAVAPADGRYFVHVYGNQGAAAAYRLRLEVFCPDGGDGSIDGGGAPVTPPPTQPPPTEPEPTEPEPTEPEPTEPPDLPPPPAAAGDGIRSDTVDGWTLEVLAADHIRVWTLETGTLRGQLDAADIRGTGAGGAAIGAEAVGFHDYPAARNWTRWPYPQIMRYEAYARLTRPLDEGETARFVVSLPGGERTFEVTFDSYVASPYVKVNQVGFLADDTAKTAYLGGWLGSLGARPVAATPFEILTVGSLDVVHTGLSEAAPVDSPESGERVLRLPFGGLTTPGHYVVRVPGVGLSPPFLIDQDVYVDVFRDGLRVFYHHRCGTAIHAAHTEFPRESCHDDPAREGVIHENFPSTELYGGEPVGHSYGMVGGWHDASDFGKYIPTAAAALYELFRIVDLAPDLLLDGFSDIPESGNGVPDMIDELVWELDWFVQMQRSDGGTYHKLTARGWHTETMPALDDQVRTLSDVTTHDTGRMAAIMALAARHVAPWFPERAERYEAAARLAWSFLEAHPNTIPDVYTDDDWNGGGAYVDRFGDDDERAWAAVELYRLTGEARFHQAFLAITPDDMTPHSPPAKVHVWPPLWEDSWRYALWSYSQLPAHLERDEAIVDVVREAWRVRADDLVSVSERTAYGLSMVPAGAYGYGSANGYEYARDALLALVQVGPRDDLVRAALRNAGYLFGANGQQLVYMTGVGTHYVRHIEYSPDYNDGIDEPVPGHVVDGPSNHVFWANNGFESELYPSGEAYPRALRYFEVPDPVMNEPVLDEMATTLLPIALLSSESFRDTWF